MNELFEVAFVVRVAKVPKVAKGITERVEKLVDALLPMFEKVAKEYITGEKEDKKEE